METTEEVAEKILEYLKKNPSAGDTLTGISRWWIQASCIDEAVDNVSEALNVLLQKGVIVMRQVGNEGRFIVKGEKEGVCYCRLSESESVSEC